MVLIVRGGPRGRVNHKLLRQGLPRIKARHAPKQLHRAPVSFIWCPQTAGSPDIHKNRPGRLLARQSLRRLGLRRHLRQVPELRRPRALLQVAQELPVRDRRVVPVGRRQPDLRQPPARVGGVAQPRPDARLLPGLRQRQPVPDPALPGERGGAAQAARQQALQPLRAALGAARRQGQRQRSPGKPHKHGQARRQARRHKQQARRHKHHQAAATPAASAAPERAARPLSSAAASSQILCSPSARQTASPVACRWSR